MRIGTLHVAVILELQPEIFHVDKMGANWLLTPFYALCRDLPGQHSFQLHRGHMWKAPMYLHRLIERPSIYDANT